MRILPMTLLLLAATATPAVAQHNVAQPLLTSPGPVADLQADAPFVFLPNLDDDSGRCAGPLATLVKAGFKPDEPARCHDAADTVVNGPEDAADLTPLRVAAWPQAPDDASATVTVSGNARLMHGAAHFSGTLTAAELRAGAELGVEGLDVARTPGGGSATFTLTVTGGGETATDTLTGEVAPVLFPSAVEKAEAFYITPGPTNKEARAQVAETERTWARIRRDMKERPGEVLKAAPEWKRYRDDPEGFKRLAQRQIKRAEDLQRNWQRFARGYRTTLEKTAPTHDHEGSGLFAQDAFETGVASTPRGSLRVSVLAPGFGGGRLTAEQAVRAAWPYAALRGRDRAVVAGSGEDYDPTGNLEPTPPAPGAPLGKLLVGTRKIDSGVWASFLAAQGKQPVVRIDTSKLQVGHVDELVAVIPTAKGWVLGVADPGGALALVPRSQRPDRDVVRVSRALAKDLDALARRLAGELGVEVVRIPVLFGPGRDGAKGAFAAMGNVVNGLAVGNRTFVAADPHGPKRAGKDVFKTAIRDALAAHGVTVGWVDTKPFPHEQLGEVHCYTNAIRAPGALSRWWEVTGA